MSNPVIGKLLPSQRAKLASAYENIAAIYREALHLNPDASLESAARINELIGKAFAKTLDEPVMWPKETTSVEHRSE